LGGCWVSLIGHSYRQSADPTQKVVKIMSSMFRGVCWDKREHKWKAQINIDGKITHLGRFDDEETAARKYDEHADRFGRLLNFSSEGKLQDQAIRTSNWAHERELLVQKRDNAIRLIAHEHSCHSACVRKVAVENDEALQNLAPESSRVEQLDSMVRPLGSIQRDLKQVTMDVVGTLLEASMPSKRKRSCEALSLDEASS